MVRGFNLKLVAICLMMLFIFQIAFPTVSFALTGGPSQPETTAFTPVGSSELVDLATGDFGYSIPLMTVPGPNGGESLTLGYKAGATMEQEASWVGLGWDLNVGAINRNLRGLPDDFKGETVSQIHKQKPRKVVTYRPGLNGKLANKELFGFKMPTKVGTVKNFEYSLTGSLNVTYTTDNYFNNYVGGGFKPGVNVSSYDVTKDHVGTFLGKNIYLYSFGGTNPLFGLSAGIDFTKDGLSIPMNISGTHKGVKAQLGVNFGGIQSLRNINFGVNSNFRQLGYSGSMSFAKIAPVPTIDIETTTTTISGNLQFDKQSTATAKGWGAGMRVNRTETTYTPFSTKNSYGYLYMQDATQENDLTDYHLDKTIPFSDMASQLPLPVYDYDLFSVSGNGIGGTFRACRNDVTVLRPSEITSTSKDIGGGLQASIGTDNSQFGVDASFGTKSYSYSGAWNEYHSKNNLSDIDNSSGIGIRKDNSKGTYEPFSFQFTGGAQISNEEYFKKMNGVTPIQFGIDITDNQKINVERIQARTHFGVLNKAAKNKLKIGKITTRDVSTSHISYKTNKELKAELTKSPSKFKNLYSSGNPITSSSSTIDYNNIPSTANESQINEMAVESGGVKYVYGLPAYNHKTEEIMYSSFSETHNNHLIDVDPNYETNTMGYDNLYSKKTIPAYTYAYLLTAKYSNNYVDINDDGPTNDDLGGWVKYNYTTISDFNWRGPYKGASYIKGNLSWDKDDKATFTEGSKDIHYVNSIETKTHIAVFEIGERNDNLSSSNDANSHNVGDPSTANTKTSRFLKKVTLYSKKDPNYGDLTKMIPVKTAHFVYDYSQCKGVPNYKTSSISYPEHIIQDNGLTGSASNVGGKLTLKKVYFTYQNNKKGSLIPYEFNYSAINKSYEYMNRTDRWGNYLEAGNSKEFPYTDQSATNKNDVNSENWNIVTISTPSGGEIDVEYESDDYGYVQDHQAMQMMEVVGVGSNPTSINSNLPYAQPTITPSGTSPPSSPDMYVFFKGDFSSPDDVKKCISNIPSDNSGNKWIYFNVNVSLKGSNDEMISGYAKWDKNLSDVGRLNATTGYLKVIPAQYQFSKKSLNLEGNIHPFRKSAIQHFHNRPDFKPTGANLNQMKQQIRTFLTGPIHNYLKEGIARKLNLTGPKSYIRLMNPNFKKDGGGHRVKSVRMKSFDSNETYGTKYSYVTYDEQNNEKSSGVADYEPITGGEENALRQPENYNDVLDYNTDTKGDYFLRTPYLESFYPSPIVKYSKVIVQSLTPSDIGMTLSDDVADNGGITISEFYTSKDFPTLSKTPNKLGKKFNPSDLMSFPFVPNTTSRDNAIFSGGSTIELNDMSGRQKSVSTYDAGYLSSSLDNYYVLDGSNFTTNVEYKYQVDSDGNLDNKVTVISEDGVYKTDKVLIGQKQEIYAFEKEDFSISRRMNTQINIMTTIIPWVFPSFNNQKSVSQRRMISTVKVINKVGVLKEVITRDDTRETRAKNLAFDAQTGEAIVTSVQNDWGKPIYSFNYSGHWEYPILGGKYKNYRADYVVSKQGTKKFALIDFHLEDQLLQVGDVLKSSSGKTLYVNEVNTIDNFFLASDKKDQDVLLGGETITVIESGYKNIQSMKIGQLVSTVDPSTFIKAKDGLIEHVAQSLDKMSNNVHPFSFPYKYTSNCLKDYGYTFYSHVNGGDNDGIIIDNMTTLYLFDVNLDECKISVKCIDRYDKPSSLPTPIRLFHRFFDYNTLKKISEGLYKINYTYVGDPFTQLHDAYITSDCDIVCDIEGVLHASATQLSDIWDFNYIDAGDPMVQTDPNDQDVLSPLRTEISTNNYNKIAAKKEGSWLPSKSWVYQTDRKQKGTEGLNGVEIDKDGEYELFREFQWNKIDKPNQDNGWEWSSEVTKYSPFGNALESKDRLGIYSAELYGYNNSVVTAVAANAKYNEIAYESFEKDFIETFGTNPLEGHFSGGVKLTNEGHTGNKSLLLNSGDPGLNVNLTVEPKANKKYHISAWAKTYQSFGGKIEVYQSGNLLGTVFANYPTINSKDHGREIDKWTQLSGSFTTIDATTITLRFVRMGSSSVAFDDVRVLPMKASMKTFVYDPLTFNLIATLDDNNFATFYSRDSEGKLVLVKQETEKGRITVKSHRGNIVK